MRRYISMGLVLVLMLSMVGCVGFGAPIGEPKEPSSDLQIAESEREEVDSSVSLPAVETELPTESTQAPIPQVTVSDAYFDTLTMEGYYGPETYCYHIPKFDIESPETESLNRAIFTEMYELLEENVYATPEQPFVFSMAYEWIQVENIVSLLVYVECDWGLRLFKVYNAYADGSGVLTREELIGSFGYDQSEFYDLVAQRLEEEYRSMYSAYPGSETDEYYQMQLSNTISYDNVTKVIPYISASGELCFVATIYSLAGADSYDYLVSLTGSADPSYPICELVHSETSE